MGRIISSPNLFGLSDFNIVKDVKKIFSLETLLENDATAGAISEKVFGKGKNMDNFIYISLSTGIGGGIFANGKLVRGNKGLAGEIGHCIILPDGPVCGCGRRGCIEALAGGKAIARKIMENRTMLHESKFFSSIPA
ncbi:ROK family protein, partial [Metallibacterium scheffleri]|uniref:ROK family protein n=1 Tax=Metallibacterium scheffleri TaxID=993689 RepID=UPI0023F3B1C4